MVKFDLYNEKLLDDNLNLGIIAKQFCSAYNIV